MKLQAILHGIRVGWLHFRYPPISNDPVFVPSDWALKYMTDDYLLTRDLGTLMPVDGPWVAWVREWLRNNPPENLLKEESDER